ncbi:MAG: ribbon-helix-helix protein, CopG family [Crocosphaera sp.]|nr:ribbon-helix-helix protein, CopG family [Crocosphaera sp.]
MSKEIKDKTVSIRLTSETINKLNLCAKSEEKDRTEVIREAINYYLGKDEDLEVDVETLKREVGDLKEVIKCLKKQVLEHQSLLNKYFLEKK